MAFRVISVDDFVEAIQERETEIFHVSELGPDAAVELRPLSIADRRQIEKRSKHKGGDVDAHTGELWCVVLGMVSPKLDVSHVRALENANAAAIDKIAGRIMEISGLVKTPDGDLEMTEDYLSDVEGN